MDSHQTSDPTFIYLGEDKNKYNVKVCSYNIAAQYLSNCKKETIIQNERKTHNKNVADGKCVIYLNIFHLYIDQFLCVG